MKTFKRVLCVLLCVIMACSCMSVVSFAEGETVEYTLKYHAEKTSKENAKKLLDELDAMLAEMDIYEEIDIKLTKVVIDLRSVDGLCATIDLLDSVWGIVNDALGDLSDFNLRIWENDMSRAKSGDQKILAEFVELLTSDEKSNALRDYNNPQVIGNLLDGDASLGALNSILSINDILGADGISGVIKGILFSLIYEEGTAEYDAAYNTYKNDVDAFIYDVLLNDIFADTFLEGFEVTSSTNIEDILINVFNLALDKYLVDIIKNDLNTDLSDNGEDGAALAPYINLKGSTYNLDGVKLDPNKALLSQVNDVIGIVAQQMIPGYDWVEGEDYTLVTSNLGGAMKHLGEASGLIPGAADMDFEEVSMKFVEILLRNLDLGDYEFVKECTTLKDMATVALVKLSGDLGTGITYGEDADYQVIIGDILAWWMYDNFNVTDYNGKAYRAGGGKDCFEVANYFVNYFFFDKGAAGALGLDVKKTDSLFVKVDKLLDYFGADKKTGVSFDSKAFMLGESGEKGLLDAVFSLDLQAILDLTIVPAIETAGDVSLVEFLYKTVYNLLKNWAGADILPAYQTKAFTNALSNKNIAKMLTNLLLSVGEKDDSILTLVYFICGFIFKDEVQPITISEIKATDLVATGEALTPKVTVKAGNKTLKQGVDYDVIADAKAPGTVNAKIDFVGYYKGEAAVSFNVKMDSLKTLTAASNTNAVKLTWNKVPYADSYNVYKLEGKTYKLVKNVAATSYTVSKLAGATEYTFKVEAVSNEHGTTAGKTVKIATKPEAVKTSSIKSTTNASAVKLTWTAVPNATGYLVYQAIGGKWVKVATVTKPEVLVSKLDSYTNYSFKIYAYKKTSDGKTVNSAGVGCTAKTKLGTISKITTTYTSSAVKLTWSKVNGATGYQIRQKIGGKWTTLKNVSASTTSYTVKNLKALTKQEFAIRPFVKEGKSYVYAGYTFSTLYTGLVKTAKVAVTTNATAAKLTWSKVSGATGYQVYQYKSGKWVYLGATSSTSYLAKNLTSGTKTYFRIRAYKKYSGGTIYGDYTSNITALTLPGTVTGIKVAARSKTSIKLQWTKVTGASHYQVYRLIDGKWVKLCTTKTNYWTDSKNLTRNTTYQYRIRAVQTVATNSYRYGAFSATYKAKTTVL